MDPLDQKPKYKASEPESFDINVTDLTGHQTLISSLIELSAILLVALLALKMLSFFSPYFISVDLENKIFKNTHKSLFSDSVYSDELTSFAKGIDPENKNLEVFILDMKQPNAFCFFGNKLFITSELLKTTESENELAFIMAHELGHARYRHNLKSLSSGLGLSLIFSFISPLEPAKTLLSSGYSRSMETESDAYAIQVVEKKYGHTFGADAFFSRISNKNKHLKHIEFLSEYTSTHPDTEDRIRNILTSQNKHKQKELIKKEDSALAKIFEKYSDK